MENEEFFKKYLDNNGNIKGVDNVRVDNNKSEEMTDSYGEWRIK